MSADSSLRIHTLVTGDTSLFSAMMGMFGVAFDEIETYTRARPATEYVERLLDSDYFIGIVALDDSEVVAGIAAYELKKFEQERSEIYVYDLAVAATHRRRGIATALLQALKKEASARGAYVVFIQADADDTPAIELYSKLGTREDVVHFDIAVPGMTDD